MHSTSRYRSIVSTKLLSLLMLAGPYYRTTDAALSFVVVCLKSAFRPVPNISDSELGKKRAAAKDRIGLTC